MNRTRAAVGLTLLGLASAAAAAAQGPDAGRGTRVGIAFGGISTVGFTIEHLEDTRGFEVTVGTWSFRDLSVSGVVKHYFGAGAAKPFVGAGLWAVAAKPSGERSGLALVLRAPVGVDWTWDEGENALGFSLSANLGLAIRRSDPEDDLPMNRRLVPLPGVYYRLTR